MSWLIIGAIVAVWQLVIVATMVWFRRMKAHHDRAFTEQEKRLNSGERLASAVRSKPPASQSASLMPQSRARHWTPPRRS